MARKKKAKKSGVALRTWHYYWREIKQSKVRGYLLLTVLTTVIAVFVRAILAPIIFADLIDKASQGLSMEEMINTALVETIGFLVIYIIEKVAIEELRLWACWKLEIIVMKNLSIQCFDVVCAQSMQFHNDRFSGSLVSQLNKFVWAFERLLDVFIWDLLPMMSYFVMVMIVLAPQVPWYVAGLIVFIVVYGLISYATSRKMTPLSAAEAEAENKQTGQLSDSISNIISVKSYANEQKEQNRFTGFAKRTFSAHLDLMHTAIKRDLKFSTVQIGITTLILVFLFCGREWLGISIATLVLVVNYSQTIMGELWNFNHIFKNISRVFGDAYEMTIILDTPDDVVDEPGAKPLNFEKTDIDFSHISFQHKDAKEPIFQNFNLTIQPGERVGLVGVSGSGKTTLTKLLLRFADVDDGQIMISGRNIKNLTQKSLRENIAYVPQETSLFHRSIAENIAYGKPDATIEEIKKAAKLANADEFIKDLPNGYDTLVGERGVKLSGGQRQRIAIARAILKDAPFLVLDEATSALDSESEALIQDALSQLMKGRTSVVIAHRLSTVANLDRIVVLQDGKIIEQGTHRELLKNPKGVYAHLWNRQSGAFNE